MLTPVIPQMSDVNDTPFDRYVVATTDGINLTGLSSYLYFVEDACTEYETLSQEFPNDIIIMILNETGKMFVNSVDKALFDRKNYGEMSLPDDRKWDVRDGCFPAVMFPEKGA